MFFHLVIDCLTNAGSPVLLQHPIASLLKPGLQCAIITTVKPRVHRRDNQHVDGLIDENFFYLDGGARTGSPLAFEYKGFCGNVITVEWLDTQFFSPNQPRRESNICFSQFQLFEAVLIGVTHMGISSALQDWHLKLSGE